MKSRLLALVAGAAVAVCIVGCAEVPHQAIHDAKKTLEQAEKAGAELYAPSQFKATQVSFDLAMKEISEENKKIPFMRKYNKITEALRSTISAAQSTMVAVEGAKTRIRTETAGMINRANTCADTMAALLRSAARKKKNIGTLGAELDSVTTAIGIAQQALTAGNLLAAKEKITAAEEKLAAIAKNVRKLMPARKTKKR
jgi:hypothetical protein